MKRRNKIIATITTISLALTMLVIGVVASTSRTFSITGNIAYIVEDVMCNITTSLFCTDNNTLTTDAGLYNEMYKLTDTNLDINSDSVSLPTGIVKSARFDAVTKSTYNQLTDTYASNEQLNVDNIELVMGKYDSSITASDRESFAYYIVVEIENFATNTISVSITPNIANSSIENLRTMMTSSNFQIAGLETKRLVLAVSILDASKTISLSDLDWTIELKNSVVDLQVETIHKNTELADIPLTTQTIDISTEAVTLAGGIGLIAFSIEDIPSGYNNLHLSLTDTNNTIFSECIGVYVETEEQLPTNLEEAGALLDGISDFSKVVVATNISNIYLPSEDVYFFLMLSGFDENLTETTITAEKTLVALATSLTTGADLTIEDCFVDTIMNMPMVLVNCTLENISAGSLTIEVPSAMMVIGAVLPEGTSLPINVAQAYPLLMMIGEEFIFEGEQLVVVPLTSKYADNSISFSFIVVGEFTEESTDISLSASYGEGQTASSSEYTYELQTINDKQGYVITGYSGIDTNIVVPTYFVDESTNTAYDVIGINGAFSWKNIQTVALPNTLLSIGNSAFNNCQQLSSIEIPDSVTEIGSSAFYNCTGLTSIEIPDSVTSIGSSAFYDCTGLTSIEIPDSVISIGSYAFYNCTGLTSIDLENVTSIGSAAFSYCTGLTSIEIPDSVIEIGSSAFSYCTGVKQLNYNSPVSYSFGTNFGSSEGFNAVIGKDGDSVQISSPNFQNNTNLKSLELKDNVEEISSYSFSGCSGLTKVIIGDGCKSIGYYAFKNCTAMKSLSLSGTYSEIAGYVFEGCSNVNELNYNANIDKVTSTTSYLNPFESISSTDGINVTIGKGGDNNKISVPNYLFYNNSFVKNLTIHDNVVGIGNYAFYKCTNLSGNLIIPNSITDIGSYAFYKCTNLSGNLIIPNTITKIGDRAFDDCSGFSGNLIIPNSVTNLGSGVFSDCSGFNGSLVISNKVTRLYGTFSGCSGLIGNLEIPSSVSYIGDSTFNNCIGFTGNLNIPDGVEHIGNYAFENCTGLNGALKISDNVTYIGARAFSGCSNIRGDLILPTKLANLGYSAFKNCSQLTGNVTIPKDLTKIQSETFYNCQGLTGIDFGNVIEIASNSFAYCSGLTGDLIIPTGVTNIGEKAFYCCSGLNGELVIADSVTNIGASAFYECKNLTGDLVLPVNLTNLGSNAFYCCAKLTGDLVIPNGVVTIETYTFSGCVNLTGVDIVNVTSLGYGVFSSCSGLTSVDLRNVESIGKSAFSNTGLTEISIPASVAVLDNVTDALSGSKIVHVTNNSSLDITLGNLGIGWLENPEAEISKTGEWVNTLEKGERFITYTVGEVKYLLGFTNPSKETMLNKIPDDVDEIYEKAFASCKNLVSAIISDNVTKVGKSAFNNCSGLISIDFGNGVKEIDAFVFMGCDKLASVNFRNVQSIGSQAFSSCDGLTSINLENIETLNNYSFDYCENLEEIKLGSNLKYIGIDVFKGTKFYNDSTNWNNDILYLDLNDNEKCLLNARTSITGDFVIDIQTTFIAGSAFMKCNEITSLVISDGVKFIGDWAFFDWTAEQSIYFEGTSYPENLGSSWDYRCNAKIYLNGVLQN